MYQLKVFHLFDFATFGADEMVMITRGDYFLIERLLVGAKLMLSHERAVAKQLHSVVHSGAAHMIRPLFQIFIDIIHSEMVVVSHHHLQNHKSFRSFSHMPVVEIFGEFGFCNII